MQNTKAGLLLQNKVLQQMRKIKDAELLKELMHGYIDFILDGNETFDTESDDEEKFLIQFIYIGSIDEIKLSVDRFKKSVEDGRKSLQTLGNGYRESEFKTSRKLSIDKVPEYTREKLKRLISADKEKGLIYFDYDDYYNYCMSNKKKLFESDNFCLSYKGYAKDNKDTPIVVDVDDTKPTPTKPSQKDIYSKKIDTDATAKIDDNLNFDKFKETFKRLVEHIPDKKDKYYLESQKDTYDDFIFKYYTDVVTKCSEKYQDFKEDILSKNIEFSFDGTDYDVSKNSIKRIYFEDGIESREILREPRVDQLVIKLFTKEIENEK